MLSLGSDLWLQGGSRWTLGIGGGWVRGKGWEIEESQNHQGWKKPSGSSSPAPAAPPKGPWEGQNRSWAPPQAPGAPPCLALAFPCQAGRAGSAPADVLMRELCSAEICLLCKTQGRWVGAGAAAFPAQGRDAGGSEGSRLGRLQGRAHSGSRSCPGAGRSFPSAFPSQVRKNEDPH